MHIIIIVGDYTKIKTQKIAKIGSPRQLIVELTKLGWVVIPQDQENDEVKCYFQKPPTTISL